MLVLLAVLWQRRKVETQTRNLTAGLWQSSKNGPQSSKIEQQRQSLFIDEFELRAEKAVAKANQNKSLRIRNFSNSGKVGKVEIR